jgi:hypothetical protein
MRPGFGFIPGIGNKVTMAAGNQKKGIAPGKMTQIPNVLRFSNVKGVDFKKLKPFPDAG